MSEREIDPDLLEEIEGDEPSEAAVQLLAKTIEKFNFTASLLAALAEWLRDEGDAAGAALALGFSQEMAEHEARTL
jgi:hypothetical protein